MSGLGAGVAIAAVVVVGFIAYIVGRKRSSPKTSPGSTIDKRLEEYDFYPFTVDATGHVGFDPEIFNIAVTHLLDEHNARAARELIVIGEQNLIRDTFPSDWLDNYKRLYGRYDGDGVVTDNDVFLENYVRIVHHIGRSFPNTGIEVLLHNLVNPSRSLVAIENGEVTGRRIGSGATNLVLDLKTRRQRGEDKVNYELNLGSRQFKCTTVPIFRPEYGLVGALCINIDTHFIRDAAATGGDRLQALVDNLLRTDFALEENILSKDEYRSAERGKRHFLDEQIRSHSNRGQERKLAAILFSDIVGFTSLMGHDEGATLEIVEANESIHGSAIGRYSGTLLKKLGDGMLASFASMCDRPWPKTGASRYALVSTWARSSGPTMTSMATGSTSRHAFKMRSIRVRSVFPAWSTRTSGIGRGCPRHSSEIALSRTSLTLLSSTHSTHRHDRASDGSTNTYATLLRRSHQLDPNSSTCAQSAVARSATGNYSGEECPFNQQ